MDLEGLIDRLMPLPGQLKVRFIEKLHEIQRNNPMPYVTSYEEISHQRGLEKGLLQNAREAILDVLDTRFGEVPDSVRERVNALACERTLKELHRRAILSPGLAEFEASL